jgi:hypothetical protein
MSDSKWPEFRFKITNPDLATKAYSDNFFFTLYIRDKLGNVIMNLPFRMTNVMDDEDGLWEGGPVLLIGYYTVSAITWRPAADYYDEDDEGNEVEEYGVPFAYLDGDTVVLKSDSPTFKELAYYGAGVNATLRGALNPGSTYEWSIFGTQGGIASSSFSTNTYSAYFRKDWEGGNAVGGATPPAVTADALCFASNYNHGLGANNGFFTLTISPNAK